MEGGDSDFDGNLAEPDVCTELDDVEMLEDLIITAVNDVISKVDEVNTKKMSSITGGLNIPGMF